MQKMSTRCVSIFLAAAGSASAFACAEGEPITYDVSASSKAGSGSPIGGGGTSNGSGGSDEPSSGFSGSDGTAGFSVIIHDSGAAGASDSGSVGAAGGGAVYDGPVPMGLTVTSKSQMGANLQFTVSITNNGMETPPVSALKVRYYMLADIISDASQIVFDYAAWNSTMAPYNVPITASCKATFGKVTPAKPMADSYLEIGAEGIANVLNPGDHVDFQLRLNGAGEDPTNDYSYLPGADLMPNPKITIVQSGNVIVGTPP